MVLDYYYKVLGLKKVEKITETLKRHNGSFVIVQDMHHTITLIGGTLNFDEKDSGIYYLEKGGITEIFHVNDLEQLLVLQI